MSIKITIGTLFLWFPFLWQWYLLPVFFCIRPHSKIEKEVLICMVAVSSCLLPLSSRSSNFTQEKSFNNCWIHWVWEASYSDLWSWVYLYRGRKKHVHEKCTSHVVNGSLGNDYPMYVIVTNVLLVWVSYILDSWYPPGGHGTKN